MVQFKYIMLMEQYLNDKMDIGIQFQEMDLLVQKILKQVKS
jgi:hypothetical protein